MKGNGSRALVAMLAAMVVWVLMGAAEVAAFGTPASGDVGYAFYEMAIKMSQGAVGATVGLGGLALAAFFLFKQQIMPAIGAAMGGIAIAKSGSMVSALGCDF